MVAKSSLQEKLIAQGHLEITPSMVPTTGRPHKWCESLKIKFREKVSVYKKSYSQPKLQ